MSAFWNRREPAITFSAARQAEIRAAPVAHGIPYVLRIVSRSGRARRRSPGENPAFACESIFYGHKREFERAGAARAGRLG